MYNFEALDILPILTALAGIAVAVVLVVFFVRLQAQVKELRCAVAALAEAERDEVDPHEVRAEIDQARKKRLRDPGKGKKPIGEFS